jgi:hypothetical protein
MKTKKLNGCGSKNGSEIDGCEFEVENLKELIEVIKTYGDVHLNYFDDEDDLDLWIRMQK